MTDDESMPWPALPKAFQHRVSTKWMTLESLRILIGRREVQGESLHVLLLTTMGPVQGDLADIRDTYEDAIQSDHPGPLDVASATIHLRTSLWNLYAEQDENLSPTDVAPVIRLQNARFRVGTRRIQLPELALFASDVIGYTCISSDLI